MTEMIKLNTKALENVLLLLQIESFFFWRLNKFEDTLKDYLLSA